MTRAMIVAFHRQEPVYQANYKILLKLFIRHAVKWIQYVDKLYIIDSGCNFTPEDLAPLGSEIVVIKRHLDSHWENFNVALREYVKEDHVGLIDSDMLIYRPEIIDAHFMAMTGYDAAGIFDNSGSADLSRWPQMGPNEFRTARKRLCPYLCFFHRSALPLNFDFTATSSPVAYDSMGKITHQMLQFGHTIHELRDDRSSIYLEDDNKITSTQWLDSPPYKWSLEENPNLGYYHIRNFSGGANLANSYHTDRQFHNKLVEMTPRREALRLLSWLWIACEKTGWSTEFMSNAIINVMGPKLDPLGSAPMLWHHYLNKVKVYHPWLEAL